MPGLFRDVIREISGNNNPVFEILSGLLLGISKDDRLVYNFHQESNYMKGFDDIVNIHYPLLRTSKVENGTIPASSQGLPTSRTRVPISPVSGCLIFTESIHGR